MIKTKNRVNEEFERDFEITALVNRSESKQSHENQNERKNAFKIAKEVFIFLPGVSFLSFLTTGITTAVLSSATFSANFPWEFWAMYLAAFLAVWTGLGSLKNPKHLAFPLSVVAVGIMGGVLFSLFSNEAGFFNEYHAYLLPFALMTPILVRSLIENGDENSQK